MTSKMQSKIKFKKNHQNPLFGAKLGDLGDRLWDQIIIIIFILGTPFSSEQDAPFVENP